MRPCTAFQQRIAKIGPSSNEGLNYRDIEIVKYEYGKCCAHFFRGSIYMLEPVCLVFIHDCTVFRRRKTEIWKLQINTYVHLKIFLEDFLSTNCIFPLDFFFSDMLFIFFFFFAHTFEKRDGLDVPKVGSHSFLIEISLEKVVESPV